MLIYIVEDDDNIRDLLLYALDCAGFDTLGFTEGKTLRKTLKERPPALILLDIMLPDENGLSILKGIKAAKETALLPVIMLTAKGAEYDRIKGLDLGADDYITKPFSVMEVIARVKAVLRRSQPESGEPFESTVAGITLSSHKRTVSAGGADITLTYKEFELLACLMRNADHVLSRERLIERVWGFDYYGESRTVDMHIKTLRQKLGSFGESIKTVRNVGYKIEERTQA